MNVHNFTLNNVFRDNAKEYQTRPVKAMKYQPGIENSWMVYFEGNSANAEKSRSYFGVKFFPTKDKAQSFISANEKQYVIEDGSLIGMNVVCDAPLPVLCREEPDIKKNQGILFQFGEHAFISDESEKYEFYILDCGWCNCDTWIILDIDGNIRVWDSTMSELFFGQESDYVCEKTENGEYIQVVV